MLTNPLKTRAIAEARIKTDKLDASTLADLLRAGLVAECYVPPREVRDRRALLRYRASLVRTRTMVKNRVHALLDKYEMNHGFSDLFSVRGRRWLEGFFIYFVLKSMEPYRGEDSRLRRRKRIRLRRRAS